MNENMESSPSIKILLDFLGMEKKHKEKKHVKEMRIAGYVNDINIRNVTVVTSDAFKSAVKGIPRNSYLIMVLEEFEDFPAHFIVLRVLDTAPTPLEKEVQQTYFELQKNDLPELDPFTRNDLQWGGLDTEILGVFYPNPDNENELEFSRDIIDFASPIKYRVYSPNSEILNIITNDLIKGKSFEIGELRITENRLNLLRKKKDLVPVHIATNDFLATRTAMFGKTRLGKSNIVKLIAESLIQHNQENKNIGQIIFDVNGEYANDNPQDGNTSLRSKYPEDCIVYSISERPNVKPLSLDFFFFPDESHRIISELLKMNGKAESNYIQAFMSVSLPNVNALLSIFNGQKKDDAEKRKILIYWSILKKAGYDFVEPKNKNISYDLMIDNSIKIQYDKKLKKNNDINDVLSELETIKKYMKKNGELLDQNGELIFGEEELSLLGFLVPTTTSSGPSILQVFKKYHRPGVNFFIQQIIKQIKDKKTIIIDLGNADPDIMQYYSNRLTQDIFAHQVERFSQNKLDGLYIQLYFEEAHNLFPINEHKEISIYRRIAKEGAKYNIGMIYSTQSVTTINKDLLNQTENFFILHMSSEEEVNALSRVNTAFYSVKEEILQSKTPGYARILTKSHRFVVHAQAKKFQ